MKIIFASQNQGKITEMKELIKGLDVNVLSAGEAGITEDVVEDQDTFKGNALKKAKYIARKSGEWAVADDSGLCIKILGGAPGVYSARWSQIENSNLPLDLLTLEKMKDVPEGKRQAYFESAVAIVSPDGKEAIFSGKINGKISKEPRGTALPKLPYDTIFIPEGDGRTFAQMTGKEKNQMSHRGKAFVKLKEYIKSNIK